MKNFYDFKNDLSSSDVENLYNKEDSDNKGRLKQGMIKIKYCALLVLCGALVLLAEKKVRDNWFELSLTIIKEIRKLVPDRHHYLYTISSLLSMIPRNDFLIFLLAVIYSYCNILKTLILVIAISSRRLVVSLLKIIYQSQRPVWVDPNLAVSFIPTSYGNPSGHSFGAAVICLTFFEITVNSNRYFDDKPKAKSICFGLLIALSFCISISRLVLGVHSINQIVLGYILGLIIYFFLFFVLFSGDLNKPNMLLSFIASKSNFLLSVGLCIIAVFGLYLNYHLNLDLQSEKRLIESNLIIFGKISFRRLLSSESLINGLSSIAFLGAITGIFIEFHFIFGGKQKDWIDFNFQPEESHDVQYITNYDNYNYPCHSANDYMSDNDQEMLILKSLVNSHKETTCWNSTGQIVGLGRLVIVFLTFRVILLLKEIFKSETSSFMFSSIQIFLPLFLLLMFAFSINKVLISLLSKRANYNK